MVLTLDEAIQHCKEVAEENEKSLREWKECKNRGTVGWSDFVKEQVDMGITRCSKCAAEHRQLSAWLKDYKRLLLKDQGCKTCKYQYTPIDDKFCKDCDCFSLWEAKDELNI